MCGITGYVSRKPIDIERAKLRLQKMVDAIDHRGSDECGFHYDKYVALETVRLKIIDMNDGSQPFYSKDNKICVIFR